MLRQQQQKRYLHRNTKLRYSAGDNTPTSRGAWGGARGSSQSTPVAGGAGSAVASPRTELVEIDLLCFTLYTGVGMGCVDIFMDADFMMLVLRE